MKIVYMGTPEIAADVLKRVIELSKTEDIEIVGVYTQPDKPVGRKQILTPPAVKVLAEENGLPVFQPKRIKRPKAVETLKALSPDLILVTAYGQLLSQEILDIPPMGCINMHASLLPAYRGAAPIQWVIVNGETQTGVTAMQMDIGMDTGDMLLKRSIAIEDTDTADTLYDKLSVEGAEVIEEVLRKLLKGEKLERIPQNHEEATYAPIITKEDGLLDWNKTAGNIDCAVRGFASWPGTYSFLSVGNDAEAKKCSILKVRCLTKEESASFEEEGAALSNGSILPSLMSGKHPRMLVKCAEGWVEICQLQLVGKKAMETEAFLRGMHEKPISFTAL